MPADINEVTAYIKEHRPGVVFAPHVETASGMMLSDDYIRALAEAVHLVGGLLVIDCIASGCIWLDMKALGIDVLLSAPQKGFKHTMCWLGDAVTGRQRSCIIKHAVKLFFGFKSLVKYHDGL